jgi:4-carboxymuconolactone decarboxylase
MSDDQTDRLPLLTPGELAPAQKQAYDRMMQDQVPWAAKSGFTAATPDGKLLGPFNALLYAPEVGQKYLDYFASEREHTPLTKRVHEIVILAVGAVWNAGYELYAHTAVGKSAGLPEDVIEAIVAGRAPEGVSEQEAAAYEFTHQLASTHRVDPAAYARAKTAFGDTGLVGIVMLTGLYLMTCATLNAFEVSVP